jgi:limonene-1,2-epoxide hydrolase/nicotinamidase-related amidase
MTSDLGVWTHENSALVLIDYQKEMFETIRSETSAALAELNVRLLARTARAFNMPVVLSTVGVKYGINSPTQALILAELPGLEPLDRTSMNAFEDRAFSDAVKKTGRTRLIFGGLHTEICLTFAVVEALKEGYEGMFVTDAVGGRSQSGHRTAIDRMAHAGAVPNTALAVVTELFRDWASPLADKARDVIYWYFAELAKLKADVGVSEAEKRSAGAATLDPGRSEMESPIELVRRFCAAWSDNRPTAELAAFFADDAVYHNIPFAPVIGRDAIEKNIVSFIRPGKAAAPGVVPVESIDFRIINIAANGPVVMTERVDVFKLPNKSFELPVMGTFEVRDGRIKAWRDYFDANQFTSRVG